MQHETRFDLDAGLHKLIADMDVLIADATELLATISAMNKESALRLEAHDTSQPSQPGTQAADK
jgi:hypothetical protein